MRNVFYFLMVLALGASVASALTQVQAGEVAVVRRLGRLLPEPWEPGLHLGLPWGLDRIQKIQVSRVQQVTVGQPTKSAEEEGAPSGQLLTGDHNLVNVQVEIYYQVQKDQVAQYALQIGLVDALVHRSVEAALAEWVASRTVDHVLLRIPEKTPQGKYLPDLSEWLRHEVQGRLGDYSLGVQIERANVKHLFPPEEVKKSFDKVAQAQTEIRTQEYQARQEEDRKAKETDRKIYEIKQQVSAFAGEQESQAKGESAAFLKRLASYQELRTNNPLILQTLWRDEMARLCKRLNESGRIDILDHYLSGGGLNITQFPPTPRKK